MDTVLLIGPLDPLVEEADREAAQRGVSSAGALRSRLDLESRTRLGILCSDRSPSLRMAQ